MSLPLSYSSSVSTLQGTDSHIGFSKGNTLPLTTRPHGMVGWIPQTAPGNWPFHPRAPMLQGFRATHQPSPWVGDYGHFLLGFGTGAQPPLSPQAGETPYSPAETIAQPHYFRTRLPRPGLTVEIAPTLRGACFRLRCGSRENVWVTFLPAAGQILSIDRTRRLLLGVSTALTPGAAAGEFGCYFAAETDTDVLEAGAFPAEGGWLRLARPPDGRITLRIATSFISSDQALLNLRSELGDTPFETVRAAAEADWEEQLGVIAIEGATDTQRRTFYGCLYRSLLYPRRVDETGAVGRQVHRSFFDGGVHPGPLHTDIGFWDAHRSHMPLLTLIAPRRMGEMVRGLVNTFREGGWLPSWASPGYIPCMVGSHAGLVIADAWLKGIRDFDVATAYAAVRHDATCEPPSFAQGRAGLNRYDALGWVPDDEFDHSAARTCDYALADFGAAQLAAALGHEADATRFRRRALNYRRLYDPRAGFLRGRLANGDWPAEFREFAWTHDYVEGGPWQHTWSAPHDAAGLMTLMGGEAAFVEKLERMLRLPPSFEIGRYPAVIHEMAEMAAVPFGQYAHSNEPVHHVLPLFTAAGRPELAQYWVRRVLDELYSPDAFCGDEDNGAMGSWYVLQALGLYPLTPGHPAWVLGSPRFPRVTVSPPGGAAFEVCAKNHAPDACYVANVTWNGRRLDSLELPHGALAEGGELVFTLTNDAAAARARGRLARPFSLSTASPRAP